MMTIGTCSPQMMPDIIFDSVADHAQGERRPYEYFIPVEYSLGAHENWLWRWAHSWGYRSASQYNVQYPRESFAGFDLFSRIDPRLVDLARQGSHLIVWDRSDEGFVPTEWRNNHFDVIRTSCERWGIPERNVLYLTANLEDYANRDRYYTQTGFYVQVLVLQACIPLVTETIRNLGHPESLESAVDSCRPTHPVLMQSRITRPLRQFATFFAQRTFGDSLLYSHGTVESPLDYIEMNRAVWETVRVPGDKINKQYKRWRKSLPRSIDRSDFDTIWTYHDQRSNARRACFQIVQETRVDSEPHPVDGRDQAVTYSEKTYYPMYYFLPVVIQGAPGVNHRMRELGFRTYEDYFGDMSWDWEPDPYLRTAQMINSLRDLVSDLSRMNHRERIAWRFRHLHVLEHNRQVLERDWWNREQIEGWPDRERDHVISDEFQQHQY